MTVRQKAEALVQELSKNGFNDVRFYEVIIPKKQQVIDDMISDGYSKEIAEEWAEDYLCLNLGADIPEVDGPYCQFDLCTFEFDFRKHLVEIFGKGCLDKDFHVDVYGGDIEIYDREKYETYWQPIFRFRNDDK